ncbi:MAG: cache domain-containing protein, partial [Lachnospiraceae bacterium]|nr:cache domain-containing protein [Lachnospiraceae bacterium]
MSGKKRYGLKSVSARLLMILVPVVAVFIVGVTLFVAFQARKVIIDKAKGELHQESRANAEEIGGTITGFKEYFNSLAETLENTAFGSDQELIDNFSFCLNKFEEISNGFYIGLDDKGYIDVSGWVPDEGYDPTSRGWYSDGMGKNEMFLGAPYVDADSGTPCVSMSREITLADKRHGVMSVDIYLSHVSESVAEYRPAGTGHAILFDGSQIIASENTEYNGTEYTEH